MLSYESGYKFRYIFPVGSITRVFFAADIFGHPECCPEREVSVAKVRPSVQLIHFPDAATPKK